MPINIHILITSALSLHTVSAYLVNFVTEPNLALHDMT